MADTQRGGPTSGRELPVRDHSCFGFPLGPSSQGILPLGKDVCPQELISMELFQSKPHRLGDAALPADGKLNLADLQDLFLLKSVGFRFRHGTPLILHFSSVKWE